MEATYNMSNLVVGTNIFALNARRNLTTVGSKQTKASARLSSGYKINSASDDAAGLAISETMRAQIRGLDMAKKNADDGISLVQVADGALTQVDDMLQRMRELVIQAANDTNTPDDRTKIAQEVVQLKQEIDHVGQDTQFNNQYIFREKTVSHTVTEWTEHHPAYQAAQPAVLYTAAEERPAVTMTVPAHDAYTTPGYWINGAHHDAQDAELVHAEDSPTGFAFVKSATKAYDDPPVWVPPQDHPAEGPKTVIISPAIVAGQVKTPATPQIGDPAHPDAWDEVIPLDPPSTYTTFESPRFWLQVGANTGEEVCINSSVIDCETLGLGYSKHHPMDEPLFDFPLTEGNGWVKWLEDALGPGADDVAGWDNALNNLDFALTTVDTLRAAFGATQNRLEYTKNSLSISSVNLSAANSRIRDADMSKEMMDLTFANVLQQAGVSMLAQANQNPQMVMKLLG